MSYCEAAQKVMNEFKHIEVLYVPRSRNTLADASSKLAATLALLEGKPVQITVEERWLLPAVLELIPNEHEVNIVTVGAVEVNDWRKPFLDYFKHGSLPNDVAKRRQLQRQLLSYVYKGYMLYRRAYKQEVLLRCVNRHEVDEVLKEVHHGVCSRH
jgi:hypothetical protein